MSSWKTTTQQREDEWPNDHVLWTCLRGPKVFGTCTFYSSPQSGVSQPSSSESSIIWGISARYMLKVLELLIASKWEIALIQNLLNWRKMRRCLEMSSGHLFDEYVKLITKSITFGTPKLVPQKKTKKNCANDVFSQPLEVVRAHWHTQETWCAKVVQGCLPYLDDVPGS